MLVLSRKKDESIVINDDITIVVVEIRGDKVRLGIEAPKEVPVHRREVFESIVEVPVASSGTSVTAPPDDPVTATSVPSPSTRPPKGVAEETCEPSGQATPGDGISFSEPESAKNSAKGDIPAATSRVVKPR